MAIRSGLSENHARVLSGNNIDEREGKHLGKPTPPFDLILFVN